MAFCRDIRPAQAIDPFGTIAAHDGDGHARGVGVVKDLLELLTQFGDGLRRLGFWLGFLLRDRDEGKGKGEQGESDALAKQRLLHSQSPGLQIVRR
jgi:hypothetical protein